MKSFSARLLFLAWICVCCEFVLFSFLFMFSLSCLLVPHWKQKFMLIPVPYKILNTSTKSTPVIFFSGCHFQVLQSVLRLHFFNLATFASADMFSAIPLPWHGLWRAPSTQGLTFLYICSNYIDTLVFKITF